VSEVGIRPARTEDPGEEGFLWEMLGEAFAWRPGEERPAAAELLGDPETAVYLSGWGRPGDAGSIAELEGERVGAAWWRHFTSANHGYGFLDPTIPELSLAVVPSHRGRGIGTALLGELIARARDEQLPALCLSVEFGNPALRVYERAGFTRVQDDDEATTMVLELGRPSSS
jgi:GNAT superfamily N-acetyltransferase